MTTIKDRMLQFKSMIKKAIVTNHTFFAVITFSRINSLLFLDYLFPIQHL